MVSTIESQQCLKMNPTASRCQAWPGLSDYQGFADQVPYCRAGFETWRVSTPSNCHVLS